jgi:FkbM family methyltransferase
MSYSTYHGELQQGKYVDETIQEYFPKGYKGVFFDVGAYEPINISNSYYFEKNNWDVYCFEANTLLIDGLKSERKNVFNYAISNEDKSFIEFNVVHGIWGGGSLTAGISAIDLDPLYMQRFGDGIKKIVKITVPQKTLNTIISSEIQHITHIDVLSIDVEGGELNVLKGLDLVKYKPTLMVIENVFNTPNIKNYLESYGYKLDKYIDYNQYYISN